MVITLNQSFPLGLEFTPSSRKEEILYAALAVIAERGLNGLSHRAIAEHAQIPLGSTTYYFKSIEEIKVSAFELFTDLTKTTIAQLEEIATGAVKHYLQGREQRRETLIDAVTNASNDYLSMLVTEHLPLRKIEAAYMHAALVDPRFKEFFFERQVAFLRKAENWFGFLLAEQEDVTTAANLYVAVMQHLEKMQMLSNSVNEEDRNALVSIRYLFEKILP